MWLNYFRCFTLKVVIETLQKQRAKFALYGWTFYASHFLNTQRFFNRAPNLVFSIILVISGGSPDSGSILDLNVESSKFNLPLVSPEVIAEYEVSILKGVNYKWNYGDIAWYDGFLGRSLFKPSAYEALIGQAEWDIDNIHQLEYYCKVNADTYLKNFNSLTWWDHYVDWSLTKTSYMSTGVNSINLRWFNHWVDSKIAASQRGEREDNIIFYVPIYKKRQMKRDRLLGTFFIILWFYGTFKSIDYFDSLFNE
jgi:hypothetical protein